MNPRQRILDRKISHSRQHRSIAIVGLAIGVLILAGGCASQPTEPESMRDPQANFSAFNTFGWASGGSGEKAGQSVSIVDGYIRTAITNEMKSKGYAEAAAGATPDLHVDYEAVSAEKVKSRPFRVGVGVGGYGSHTAGSVGVGTSGVKNVKEGTLVIHVIDSARKAEVWRGSASRELGKGNIEPADVQSVVTEMMSDFPARGAQPK
jgi:Domain of unknown function (DUF4136)